MATTTIALILAAAVIHASWNLVLKRTGDTLITLWLSTVVAAALMAPALLAQPAAAPVLWGHAALAALIETGYVVALAHAYRTADFSLVYPIARGAAPALLALWAWWWLGERPDAGGALGLALVLVGLVLVGLAPQRHDRGATMAGSAQALLVAACISGYSIIDAAGVRLGGAAAYTPLRFVLAALLVTLLVLARQRDVWARARAVLRPALIVGCGNLGAYALVLAAYGAAPVAYAGALREISIVIGALAGWRLFGEPFGARRVIGAGIIAAGIVVIAGWGGLA